MTLTAGELAQMQAVIGDTLPGTAIIRRRSQASDGQGGQLDTYAAVGTVSCRLAPKLVRTNGAETVGARPIERAVWILTTPARTDLDVKDQVAVAVKTFEVTSVRGPRSDEISRRAFLEEIS